MEVSQKSIDWNSAAYWSEVSGSNLPPRAKTLLRWVFDECTRTGAAEVSVSMAEAAAGVWSHLGRRLDVSTVRRAVADLVSVGILEIIEVRGLRSRWVLRSRNLWALSSLIETTEAERIESRLAELRKEISSLERKRDILLGRPADRTGETSNRSAGGWGVHVTETEVTAKQSARGVFRKFVTAGLLADDPETEREFFAFLFTVGEMARKKKIRSRAGYVSGAVRRGYWATTINPELRERAEQLQEWFDGGGVQNERAETVSVV